MASDLIQPHPQIPGWVALDKSVGVSARALCGQTLPKGSTYTQNVEYIQYKLMYTGHTLHTRYILGIVS